MRRGGRSIRDKLPKWHKVGKPPLKFDDSGSVSHRTGPRVSEMRRAKGLGGVGYRGLYWRFNTAVVGRVQWLVVGPSFDIFEDRWRDGWREG